MIRKPHLVLISIFLLLFVGVWKNVNYTGDIVFTLLFGWVGFLQRVIPQATLRWDGIAIFLGLLLLAGWLTHKLLQSLFREIASHWNFTAKDWQPRWTIAVIGSLLLLFCTGLSLVGLTHHVIWISHLKHPLYHYYSVGYSPSKSNLRSIGLGIHSRNDTRMNPPQSDHPQSWAYSILPGMIYVQPEIDSTKPWNDPVNAAAFKKVVPELINPMLANAPHKDEQGFGLAHYAGNQELFQPEDDRSYELGKYDTTNLLMVGEVNESFEPWGSPNNLRSAEVGLNSANGFGGVPGHAATLFCLGDGSVRGVNNRIAPEVFIELGKLKKRPTSSSP